MTVSAGSVVVLLHGGCSLLGMMLVVVAAGVHACQAFGDWKAYHAELHKFNMDMQAAQMAPAGRNTYTIHACNVSHMTASA